MTSSMQKLDLPTRALGSSAVQVPPICLGTMTFGEQVSEADSHEMLNASIERGVNFLDTAEMYAVPPSAATFTKTESFIGNWFGKNPGMREKWIVATKVAGPARGMPWIRGGSSTLRQADIVQACEDSLRRLQTDVIDLYQIHWPERRSVYFGEIYYKQNDDGQVEAVMLEQLAAMDSLVKAGKVRAIGVSNESAYGVHEFVRLADKHGLTKIASVQNPYGLTNRVYENGLDETLHRLDVGFLAYSPLAFGVLTGKYDAEGIDVKGNKGRMDLYDRMREQRWGRPEAMHAAKLYNQLARDHGMTPTQMALAYCYQKWSVTSTIMGCTTLAQMHECYDAFGTVLSVEVLKAIDAIRWKHRDPAQ